MKYIASLLKKKKKLQLKILFDCSVLLSVQGRNKHT